MSSTLGSPAQPARSSVPPATRAAAPGWRDPRLWVGVAIVAASVLVGTRVLASADDTVAVWAVADDVAVDEALSVDDLVTARVRFADGSQLERYYTVDDVLPEELRLVRGLGAGELLPRAAVGLEGASDTVEISLPVAPLLMPPGVSAGSVVDVYLSDRGAATRARDDGDDADDAASLTAEIPALGEVSVVDAPSPDETFAASGDRQLVLAVGTEDVGSFYALMNAMDDAVVSIVRRS